MKTEDLMQEFIIKALGAKDQIKRLNAVMQNLSAENCPLSPCDDCVLVKCMFRRETRLLHSKPQ